jgi:hypothetical protein
VKKFMALSAAVTLVVAPFDSNVRLIRAKCASLLYNIFVMKEAAHESEKS